MRGKGAMFLSLISFVGITPAHAGKSFCFGYGFRHRQDHPRTCGEKKNTLYQFLPDLGSPPHMRGKVKRFPQSDSIPRITPAHAGKSFPFMQKKTSDQDHPRTCGEKTGKGQQYFINKGSPPHMRGKVLASGTPMLLRRITPAHAGKSRSCLHSVKHLLDHPRTCGEKATLQ